MRKVLFTYCKFWFFFFFFTIVAHRRVNEPLYSLSHICWAWKLRLLLLNQETRLSENVRYCNGVDWGKGVQGHVPRRPSAIQRPFSFIFSSLHLVPVLQFTEGKKKIRRYTYWHATKRYKNDQRAKYSQQWSNITCATILSRFKLSILHTILLKSTCGA